MMCLVNEPEAIPKFIHAFVVQRLVYPALADSRAHAMPAKLCAIWKQAETYSEPSAGGPIPSSAEMGHVLAYASRRSFT